MIIYVYVFILKPQIPLPFFMHTHCIEISSKLSTDCSISLPSIQFSPTNAHHPLSLFFLLVSVQLMLVSFCSIISVCLVFKCPQKMTCREPNIYILDQVAQKSELLAWCDMLMNTVIYFIHPQISITQLFHSSTNPQINITDTVQWNGYLPFLHVCTISSF